MASLLTTATTFLSLIIHITTTLHTTPSKHTLYYSSHHYQYENTSIISLHNLTISINSLTDITINHHIHLDYFNDTHFDKLLQIQHITRPKHSPNARQLLATTHGNGRYALSPVSMSWDEGVSYCLQHYGSIASIMSQRDNDLAKQTCPWHCWIGLKEDMGQPTVYTKWKNGRKIDYTHWYPGEPNNDYRHGSDCGEIYSEHNGLWNDIPCYLKRFVLCEHGRGQLIGNFIAVQTPKTYSEANEHCLRTYGTNLATLHSYSDNEQAKHACNKVGEEDGNNEECWIGLKGPFRKWADGVYTGGFGKFSNWYDSQEGTDKTKWRMILELKDIAKGYFKTQFREDGIENSDNSAANTYSIIGLLTPEDYKDKTDNKYKFKIVYKNSDHTTTELIWKQSSWLNKGAIEGFEPVAIPGQTNSQCGMFSGLGISDSGCSYLDGNGKYKGCWWNSIGTVCAHNGGIPGFNWKIAHSQALYVYSPEGTTDLCGAIHSNGKWYDKMCLEQKHFVCNAMTYSERLSPMIRESLEHAAYSKHFAQWTNERQLAHMKEEMQRERDKDEMSPLDDPKRKEQMIAAEKAKTEKKTEWENLRSELQKKGVFDPYINAGYFKQWNLNGRFGTDYRYSFPVHWQNRNGMHRRRLLKNSAALEYYKCVWIGGERVSEVCVGMDGITVRQSLFGKGRNDSLVPVSDETEQRMEYGIMGNGERVCLNSAYICVTRTGTHILFEMEMIHDFDALLLDFVNDDEWDEIVSNTSNDESTQKCVYLSLHMKVCIQSSYDHVSDEYSYNASIIM